MVGCVFVAGAPVRLQNIAGHFGGGWLSTNSAELANILFGVAVIGILLLRPDGLWSISWVAGCSRRCGDEAEASGLSIAYRGTVRALDEVSVVVEPGQRVAVLGPS